MTLFLFQGDGPHTFEYANIFAKQLRRAFLEQLGLAEIIDILSKRLYKVGPPVNSCHGGCADPELTDQDQ
jgi:hypothetical protein